MPLYSSYHTWCEEVQALRAFIWLEWVIFLLMFAYVFRWTFNQYRAGRNDVWSTVISRYQDTLTTTAAGVGASRAPSEFLQWEKFTPMPAITEESGVTQASASQEEYREPVTDYRNRTQIQPAYRAQNPSMQYMQQQYTNSGYQIPKIHQYYAQQQQQQNDIAYGQYAEAV